MRLKQAVAAGSDAAAKARWHDRAAGLYEELRGPARGLVRRAYGAAFSDHEIEDVYSNAWLGTLRALERRHERLSDEEIRSYVLTAVANHASKEMRRRKRKPTAPLEAAGAVAEPVGGPEEAAGTQETRRLARDVLSSLPPRRRAVMLLRYGWGLEPSEVCGMVPGLSHRAYRKEITRGVEELARKLRLAEEGGWCEEREPVIRAYAAGLADGDQAVQAQRHLDHCRACSDFATKLTAQLHDLGTALLVPGALDAVSGGPSLVERAGGAIERAREGVAGILGRGDATPELVTAASGVRGAGAAGAGVLAKVASLGAAGKAALTCVGGGAAVSACVAAGVLPLPAGGEEPPRRDARAAIEREAAGIERVRVPVSPWDEPPPITASPPPAPAREDGSDEAQRQQAEPAPAPVAPSTPPTEQEFGVASAASPVGASAPASSTSSAASSGGAVSQEFGP